MGAPHLPRYFGIHSVFSRQMIERYLKPILLSRIAEMPVVALLGSRQVGKTTLARSLKLEKPTVYLDLERPSDMAKLQDPELYLGQFADHLIIVDEIQRVPELFPVLRSIVDDRRFAGERSGHFLILGSASPDLLRQGSETLAGRISYLELPPLLLHELGPIGSTQNVHWLRGGYPESFAAATNASALRWCNDFITSYVERYLPQLNITTTSLQLRRLCTMLAHLQASTINFTQLGNSLGLDGKTVRHYVDLLEGLYLLRRIPAWSRNVGKRLVKSAKVQWRDSGLLHGLLGLNNMDSLLGHPISGHSWEGYCIEQILGTVANSATVSYYRTHAGAEIDLVVEHADGRIHAIEIKRTLSPKLSPAFIESMKTIGATHGIYIMPQGDSYPLAKDVTAMSLTSSLQELSSIAGRNG